jgi:hypothetical protein
LVVTTVYGVPAFGCKGCELVRISCVFLQNALPLRVC